MKHALLCLALLSVAGASAAKDCDCSEYPFKPNPPCYGECVARLSAKPPSDAAAIKNIDTGVLVGIRVLSQDKNRSTLDLKSIQNKPDLERAALKSMKSMER